MPIIIHHTIQNIRNALRQARSRGATVGFVPTMGALHDGHASLIRRAAAECNHVVLSIFVNPLQFGAGEDFEKYPRTLENDVKRAESAGANDVFAPSASEMYGPEGARPLTFVDMERLSARLCGASRPGHFRGVATVVAKLFNVIQADRAYFGQKDLQQCVVIQRMVRELNFPLDVIVCPIVRETDGLAMSSRNAYLSRPQRMQARCLFEALSAAASLYALGERNAAIIIAAMRECVGKVSQASIDYVACVDRRTLEDARTLDGESAAALAVNIGATRLIDNVLFGEPGQLAI